MIYNVEIYSVEVPDAPVETRRREILDAALAIADADGLGAVTMRAVAARLGLTSMALYPHIGGKDGLLDGLVGRLLTELLPAVETGGATADPESVLFGLGRAVRVLARRHPSAFSLLLSRPAVTPDGVRVVEAFYAALLAMGVPPDEVPRVERLLSTFGLGFATSEVNGRFASDTQNPRGRRGQFAPAELPAHAALAEILDDAPDWDAEYEADLADLLFLIRQRWGTAKKRKR